jgi:DNA-binding NarL/FixJ family response regulator
VSFIIFSSHNHPEMIRRAPEAGASAYVTKTTHADKQIAQIRESGAQGSPVARAARARMGRVGRSAQVPQADLVASATGACYWSRPLRNA